MSNKQQAEDEQTANVDTSSAVIPVRITIDIVHSIITTFSTTFIITFITTVV